MYVYQADTELWQAVTMPTFVSHGVHKSHDVRPARGGGGGGYSPNKVYGGVPLKWVTFSQTNP